jgi:hypothetical protein
MPNQRMRSTHITELRDLVRFKPKTPKQESYATNRLNHLRHLLLIEVRQIDECLFGQSLIEDLTMKDFTTL